MIETKLRSLTHTFLHNRPTNMQTKSRSTQNMKIGDIWCVIFIIHNSLIFSSFGPKVIT